MNWFVVIGVAVLLGLFLGFWSARHGPIWMPLAIFVAAAGVMGLAMALAQTMSGEPGQQFMYGSILTGSTYLVCHFSGGAIGAIVRIARHRMGHK